LCIGTPWLWMVTAVCPTETLGLDCMDHQLKWEFSNSGHTSRCNVCVAYHHHHTYTVICNMCTGINLQCSIHSSLHTLIYSYVILMHICEMFPTVFLILIYTWAMFPLAFWLGTFNGYVSLNVVYNNPIHFTHPVLMLLLIAIITGNHSSLLYCICIPRNGKNPEQINCSFFF
jgi:hypothetical protein